MTRIVTNGAGVHMLVASPKSLPDAPSPHFTRSISDRSKSRIIESLASSTVSFLDSAKSIPCLAELASTVAKDNEIAASELGLLGEYRFAVHCMTN